MSADLCRNGHPYPAEPLRDPKGFRRCEPCRLDAQARRKRITVPEVDAVAAFTYEHVESFWRKVDIGIGDQCWLWRGAVNRCGYGTQTFTLAPRTIAVLMAHRLSYRFIRGPIPPTLQLDHLCRVPRCVNPLHLEPVTVRENLMRGNSPSAINARKTHCKNGHPFDAENTYLWRNERRCLACQAERKQARRALKGAA